jgi:hypothetical protein
MRTAAHVSSKRTTDQQLFTTLRELAALAAGDARHDFSTLFDVYNELHSRRGLPALTVADYLLIAHVVRTYVAPDAPHEAGVWRGDLRFINRNLYRRRTSCENAETARMILPRLLEATAEFVDAGSPAYSRSSDSRACTC